MAARPNRAATGAPAISGTMQVGATLSASTAGIADSDGLANVSFDYQWLTNDGTRDSNITGATSATYALVDSDAGKAIKVQVSFTDDRGHRETLTSAATGAVAARPNRAATGAPAISGDGASGRDPLGIHRGHRGRRRAGQRIVCLPVADQRRHAGLEHHGCHERNLCAGRLGRGQGHQGASVVHRRPGAPGDADERGDGSRGCPAQPGGHRRACHQRDDTVGATLSASTAGIADGDGLANVSFGYQWLTNDGTRDSNITGATSAMYVLVDSDAGKAIKVQVSFTDDRGHRETLTSAATGAVAAAPSPLTATIHDQPDSHDGQSVFSFELRF